MGLETLCSLAIFVGSALADNYVLRREIQKLLMKTLKKFICSLRDF